MGMLTNPWRSRTFRARLGLGLLFAFVIYSLASQVSRTGIASPGSVGTDFVSQYERRFESLKDTLGCWDVVGYVGDKGAREFFLAQYALAPTILVRDSTRRIVLGNFHGKDSPAQRWAAQTLELIRDSGNGVRLYGRRDD